MEIIMSEMLFQMDGEIDLFFRKRLGNLADYTEINRELEVISGIVDFFSSYDDFLDFKTGLSQNADSLNPHHSGEYGDFQTPIQLAESVCQYLIKKKVKPRILIEPTCGKGNFILSALQSFKGIEEVYGIEIYKPYIWETKLRILSQALKKKFKSHARIHLFHTSIFDFSFQNLFSSAPTGPVLVLGNPPWVTNAMLGALDSTNLPPKSNFKNIQGLDAITGKGNFDIAEYITYILLRYFSSVNGHMALLVKNTVIKNILWDLPRSRYEIANLEKLKINSITEFNAAVDASLFLCRFNRKTAPQCLERNFNALSNNLTVPAKVFGWSRGKFVSDIKNYNMFRSFDGKSVFQWRSGVKHDCRNVLELKKNLNGFINKHGKEVIIEAGPVYPYVKSSDLQRQHIAKVERYLLLPQERMEQETDHLKDLYPLAYAYLENNHSAFIARKSAVYKNRNPYAVFGIGDYSFMPYKVAISGLYKKPCFSLLVPVDGKPVLLDDTSYFIGFEEFEEALFTFGVLSMPLTAGFLESIVFHDMKRVYTKEILMRLDIEKMVTAISFDEIKKVVSVISVNGSIVSEDRWNLYVKRISEKRSMKGRK